ncbi:MAG: type VII toxin-antitoxin system MntA family adenylyltransferase antitoxin [Candidatus Anammoxibacter sp.]
MNDIEEKLNKVIDYIKSFDLVNAVYLHGSYAKGKLHPNSDIDMAVLLMKGFSNLKTEDILNMTSQLELIFNRKVDLGVLSSNNLIYTKEVIEHGISIFCRNRFEKELFEATMLSMYLNLQIERKEILNAYRT